MHILITNDDGPPSPHSSPYVATLVSELKKAGHTVSVCLPHTQRSWIGKAHIIGQTVKPVYYTPSTKLHGEDSEGTTHHRPTTSSASAPGTFDADAEWVLVDGTPASCVQIGLHHFFAERGPVDLVVSGPNYGRNTTAVFALSSGTLGGALEAAVCGKKAIALSYAFFSRNHDPEIIEGASRHGVRVIERLYADWPTDGSVDLYSVNVPLVEGVESHKTLWAGMLQNYWREGSCFQEVEDAADEETEEERIREGAGGEVVDDAAEGAAREGETAAAGTHRPRHFKWAPRFTDVYKSVEEAPPGNDGWVVKEGHTSVTPLKANFWHPAAHLHQKELELAPTPSTTDVALPLRPKQSVEAPKFHAIIDYQDEYVQPMLLAAMKDLFSEGSWKTLSAQPPSDGEPLALSKVLPDPSAKLLQITPYEMIDFEYASDHTSSVFVNSYMIRKALIRKHYLSATVEGWVAKHPESALKRGVKRSEHFEVDYAEFLDDSLVEAFDLRESMDRNVDVDAEGAEKAPADREWWILKPGMSDRGQGIRLFSTMDELQAVFDEWEEERPDSDDEDEEGDDGVETEGKGGNYITTSHLRHFVAQPYIHPPLLLPGDDRKFHLRTYVLAVGCLEVYVFSDMLALFAAKPYLPPWETDDLDAHLTNTCLQVEPGSSGKPPVRRFRDLGLKNEADITRQICALTGDLFEAAARGMTVHFQPQPNAFEAYGLDFMVDAEGTVWLLEVNAFPDFKQSGEGEKGELRGVVDGFWREALRVAVGGFFGVEAREEGRGEGKLELVREVDLGRR
ncbi:5'/3'-nucleotidase sure [Plectosphaerella plurivora]|uniref:5'/3'-nucleotidase sure n=1 Tax=Plectosphaerella plurivora TaxID=936078 RepID=A0A9P8VEW9_9PEZI|nr:5'/3'-nucleotidase sure [Plectosphaerella plurivora]